ncbi:hypothetical protein EP073_12110 [Geovibrio thiophilus]|uniref:Lipoprotein n=1 Tax=Geovibrio thiophilus TaxID=139438 RepID=A0A410K114_9BACT|nr:hypothetical protein [Geovibrio thiophilus]QAR34120.1 hypothetical protein EP073_12110 [Geovibrio thiophilus]
MKNLILLSVFLMLMSCAPKDPEIIKQGSVYDIRGFELKLEEGVLSVKNTYFEKVSRLQISAEYVKGQDVVGSFTSVGLALEPGDVREYRLVIPQGTEKVKVSYREYPYGEGDTAMFLPNIGKLGKTGAVYFMLNE